MIEGSCHCGALRWSFDGVPDSATGCNCTLCRRYGTLWAYGHEDVDIRVSGPTRAYAFASKTIGFHFCPTCGCVAWWRSFTTNPEGRRRIAVNLRLADPAAVAGIVLDHFDGLTTFKDLPRDGRCVTDVWF